MKSPQVLETDRGLSTSHAALAPCRLKDSLVDLTRQINTVLHYNDPRWGLLPRSSDEVGGILMVAEHGSEPGDFDRWVNYNFQHGRVTFFLRSQGQHTARGHQARQ